MIDKESIVLRTANHSLHHCRKNLRASESYRKMLLNLHSLWKHGEEMLNTIMQLYANLFSRLQSPSKRPHFSICLRAQEMGDPFWLLSPKWTLKHPASDPKPRHPQSFRYRAYTRLPQEFRKIFSDNKKNEHKKTAGPWWNEFKKKSLQFCSYGPMDSYGFLACHPLSRTQHPLAFLRLQKEPEERDVRVLLYMFWCRFYLWPPNNVKSIIMIYYDKFQNVQSHNFQYSHKVLVW